MFTKSQLIVAAAIAASASSVLAVPINSVTDVETRSYSDDAMLELRAPGDKVPTATAQSSRPDSEKALGSTNTDVHSGNGKHSQQTLKNEKHRENRPHHQERLSTGTHGRTGHGAQGERPAKENHRGSHEQRLSKTHGHNTAGEGRIANKEHLRTQDKSGSAHGFSRPTGASTANKETLHTQHTGSSSHGASHAAGANAANKEPLRTQQKTEFAHGLSRPAGANTANKEELHAPHKSEPAQHGLSRPAGTNAVNKEPLGTQRQSESTQHGVSRPAAANPGAKVNTAASSSTNTGSAVPKTHTVRSLMDDLEDLELRDYIEDELELRDYFEDELELRDYFDDELELRDYFDDDLELRDLTSENVPATSAQPSHSHSSRPAVSASEGTLGTHAHTSHGKYHQEALTTGGRKESLPHRHEHGGHGRVSGIRDKGERLGKEHRLGAQQQKVSTPRSHNTPDRTQHNTESAHGLSRSPGSHGPLVGNKAGPTSAMQKTTSSSTLASRKLHELAELIARELDWYDQLD